MPKKQYLDRKPTSWLAGLLGGLVLVGLGLSAWGMWIPAKAHVAQILLKYAWSQSKGTGQPVKAWSWADTWPVAKISIPSLGFDTIVLKEAGGEGLAFGPVLLEQSAKPGEQGTAVISAHRDTHFAPLANLKTGSLVKVTLPEGTEYHYQVKSTRIAPWDQSGLVKDTDAEWLALTSCWPFDSITPGPLRFIAQAHRIPTAPTDKTPAMLTMK